MCQEQQNINNIPTLVGCLVRERYINTKHINCIIMTKVLKVRGATEMYMGTLNSVGSQERLL